MNYAGRPSPVGATAEVQGRRQAKAPEEGVRAHPYMGGRGRQGVEKGRDKGTCLNTGGDRGEEMTVRMIFFIYSSNYLYNENLINSLLFRRSVKSMKIY